MLQERQLDLDGMFRIAAKFRERNVTAQAEQCAAINGDAAERRFIMRMGAGQYGPVDGVVHWPDDDDGIKHHITDEGVGMRGDRSTIFESGMRGQQAHWLAVDGWKLCSTHKSI